MNIYLLHTNCINELISFCCYEKYINIQHLIHLFTVFVSIFYICTSYMHSHPYSSHVSIFPSITNFRFPVNAPPSRWPSAEAPRALSITFRGRLIRGKPEKQRDTQATKHNVLTFNGSTRNLPFVVHESSPEGKVDADEANSRKKVIACPNRSPLE